MSTFSSHNDLLQCLFVNLRNAAASWGAESEQYKAVHQMVYDHLKEMQAQGQKTNLSGGVRRQEKEEGEEETDGLAVAFERLDLELRGRKKEVEGERMEE